MVNTFRDLARFHARAMAIQHEELVRAGVPEGVSPDQVFETAEKLSVSILIENYRKQAKGFVGLDMAEVTADLPEIGWLEERGGPEKKRQEVVDPRAAHAIEAPENGVIELEGGARFNPVKMLLKKLRDDAMADSMVDELRAVLGIPSYARLDWQALAIEIESANPTMLAEWMKDKGMV